MPQLESASSRYSTLAAAIVLLRLLHPQLSPAQGEADWDTPTTLRYIFENPVTTAAVPGQATPAQIAPRWAQVVRQIVRVLLFTSVNGVTGMSFLTCGAAVSHIGIAVFAHVPATRACIPLRPFSV